MFLWLSMTPSLLPRGPLLPGDRQRSCGAIGYVLGVFAVWLVRYHAVEGLQSAGSEMGVDRLVVVGISARS